MFDLWVPNIRGEFYSWVYPVLRKDDSLVFYPDEPNPIPIPMVCSCGKELFDSDIFISPYNPDIVHCASCTNSPVRNRKSFSRKYGKATLITIGPSEDENIIYAQKILLSAVNTLLHRHGVFPNLPLNKLLRLYTQG